MILFLTKRLAFGRMHRKSARSILLIATLGILCASIAVFVGLGVLSGYQKVYRSAVLNFSAHLVVFNPAGIGLETQNDLQKFLDSSPIKSVYSPYHFYETIVPTSRGLKPVIFKGIDPKVRAKMYPVAYDDFGVNTDGVFIGSYLAKIQSSAKNEGQIKFLKWRNESGRWTTGYGYIPVQGSFDSGYFDFDSKFVIMPLDRFWQTFSESPMVSGLEVRVDDLDQIQPLKQKILDSFGEEIDVLSWDELNASLFEALALDRTVVFVVSLLILLIACLNIFGFNFLFFLQRKREFLILSALGLPLSRLRRILILISGALGGSAALVGAVLGVGVVFLLKSGSGIPLDPEVYFVDRVPVELNWDWYLSYIVAVVVMCLGTSFLASKVVLQRYMTSQLMSD